MKTFLWPYIFSSFADLSVTVKGKCLKTFGTAHVCARSTGKLPRGSLHKNNVVKINELRHGKTGFCICENKDADQLRGNREADQRLCLNLLHR